MSFIRLVFKNIRMNLKNYGMYLFSIIFSVFTIYTFFALGNSNDMLGSLGQNNYFQSLFESFSYIILFVLFFYLKYMNKQFLKGRKKEIALYSLFGVSTPKIGAMLFIENFLIGLLGLAGGLIFGMVFFKLICVIFLNMMGGSFLVAAIPSVFNIKAFWITAISFLTYFCIIGLFAFAIVYRSKLIELFQAEQTSEKKIKGSWLLLILSILSIGGGYALACNNNVVVLFMSVLPILLLVIVGTYFFFTSGIQIVLNLIRKNKRLILKGDNLLVISNFRHRMRSNAFMISAITILSAIAITLVASAYGIYYSSNQNAEAQTMYDIAYHIDENSQMYHQELVNLLKKENHPITKDDIIDFEQLVNYSKSHELYETANLVILVMNEQEYNNWMKNSKVGSSYQEIHPKEDEFVYVLSNYWVTEGFDEHELTLQNGKTVTVRNSNTKNPVPSVFRNRTIIAVTTDATYWELKNTSSLVPYSRTEFINYENPKNSLAIFEQINQTEMKVELYYSYYFSSLVLFGTILFISGFMALVFMIATASLLFFKVISTIEEDKDQYQLLDHIGTTESKKKKIMTKQILPIFLLPLFLAMLHAVFAVKSAGTVFDLWNLNLWYPAFLMFILYTVIYLVFAFITIKSYQRRILKQS